ncbi:cwf18 pre-mRNA splicing factor [Chloropicon primus]|uniref:DUF7887 domain-containing protein n=1 Tax=Chloropicon primus TaxID=1764295 RepID=A0A5B8ML05_9CHLO|nr:hypothetical protein A3770_05p35970 [Chloropicon primus]UPR00291.1 cwf18 pre-mRNA splicing factor [Chloropicon primus]|eukprot:QDZ21079.1 hypothetical protein A3770_05p35970 [Chloropicon primus]
MAEGGQSIRLRNYLPEDGKGFKHTRVEAAKVPETGAPGEEEEQAHEEAAVVDVAPKKANWDLKRDVEKKLKKLERRTQNAMVVVPSLCFVATAGLVDAAFSGDWSRIGAISTGTEDQLKLLCGALLLERLALVAWLGKAETQPLVLAKAFFGGTLSVLNELKTREGK